MYLLSDHAAYLIAGLAACLSFAHLYRATYGEYAYRKGRLVRSISWAIMAIAFLFTEISILEDFRAMLRFSIVAIIATEIGYYLFVFREAFVRIRKWISRD